MMAWDQSLFWHINRDWTHPVLDWLMPALSAIDAWMPVLALLLIVLAWRGGTRLRIMLLCAALSIGIADGVVGKTLKKSFDRVRPRDQLSGVIVRDLAPAKPRILALFKPAVAKVSEVKKPAKEGNSLPSNHTLNLFAFATAVALFYRRWALPAYLLALMVAYSRVYVGAHWPSDIPPSMVLGILIAWVVTSVTLRLLPTRFTRSA